MVDGVNVKFRWFRTVERAGEVVTLVSLDQQWSAVELVWDKHRLLYESSPSFVPYGKHGAFLIINGEKYPCQTFSVVTTTFELNLFLQEDHLFECDVSNALCTSSSWHSATQSPLGLQMDTTWSSGEYSPVAGLVQNVYDDNEMPKPINIYEELLANKDREIEQLRQQVKNLKILLVKIETDVRLSNAHQKIETSHTQEMSDELNELQKEKKSLELEAATMISCIKENEEARESLEWEIEQLREKLSSNDPTEMIQLLTEMKSLRDELKTVCRKNGELTEEILKLRDENTRLAKDAVSRSTKEEMKFRDMFCNSDPDSGCTVYKALPFSNISSKSLPAFDSPKHFQIPQRSVSVNAGHVSPLSCDSLITEELLSYESATKVGSGVQTDITAVHGSPRHYQNLHIKQHMQEKGIKARGSHDSKTKSHKASRKKISKDKKIISYRARKSFMEEDSSDTEELLQEAEHFILSTMEGNVGMLSRLGLDGDSRHASNYSTRGNLNNGSSDLEHSNFTNQNFSFGQRTIKQASETKVRPFIPKCALDLKLGHMVRYHGCNGRVTEGKVAFVGCLPGKSGTFIGVDTDKLASFQR